MAIRLDGIEEAIAALRLVSQQIEDFTTAELAELIFIIEQIRHECLDEGKRRSLN